MTLQTIAKDTCIVRNTGARKGRHIAVEPGSGTASRYLYYGRIVLDASDAAVRFETKGTDAFLYEARTLGAK